MSCVGSSGKKSDSASLEKVRLSQEKVSLMLVVVLHTQPISLYPLQGLALFCKNAKRDVSTFLHGERVPVAAAVLEAKNQQQQTSKQTNPIC